MACQFGSLELKNSAIYIQIVLLFPAWYSVEGCQKLRPQEERKKLINTVEMPLSGHLLITRGHPLLSGWNESLKITIEVKPLMIILSGYLLAIPPRVLPLFSPLVSGHQASDALSLTYFKNIMKENEVQGRKLNDQLWTLLLLPSRVCFKIKWWFCRRLCWFMTNL